MDKTTQERIKADAGAATDNEAIKLRTKDMEYAAMIMRLFGYKEGFIVGATAENNRAQPAIDTLEQIINSPNPSNEYEMMSWIDTARTLAEAALQQCRGEKEIEQKCTCQYPTFNAMTDRCLTCNRPYKV